MGEITCAQSKQICQNAKYPQLYQINKNYVINDNINQGKYVSNLSKITQNVKYIKLK